MLDLKRLGKQIIEAGQILRALHDPEYGWQSHPAVNMWRGHERALLTYADACQHVWLERRPHNNAHQAYANLVEWLRERGHGHRPSRSMSVPPAWWGLREVHNSHRAVLMRKDPDWYTPLFSDHTTDVPDYVWPDSG